MEFRILGPLEVLDGGRPLALGGAKQRALLTVLVLRAGEQVSVDRLIDTLWEDNVPETARHTLQVYVSQLRKALGSAAGRGAAVLATEGSGYALRVEPDGVDLHRFEGLTADGRTGLANGEAGRAATLFRDALRLFRGPPLSDVAYAEFAQSEISRIEELRVGATEDRIQVDLLLGRHAELIGELQALVSAHPLRERLRSHLMLALYRSGRQAEALQVYQEGRRLLAGELGIDPMPEQQKLHEAILRQDPALRPPTSVPSTPPSPLESPVPPAPESDVMGSPATSAATSPAEVALTERKFATVLFADLVGSTALAERMDPEVVRSLVGRTFDRLAREIERYDGTTEKFVGDAVLAVFGVPATHEDDPERAVRAGLDMQASLAELNRELVAEGRPELAMRIGIEAGEVLVELDRVTGSRDRMLTGDAVNTAARLQAAAEPGQVLVGPIARASALAIEFAELPPLSLKGKAEPVAASRAVRGPSRPAGERTPSALRSRLIGRDEELALLVQTLNRVEAERRPALITVLGSAGVGKTRLALELHRALESRSPVLAWRKGRCLAYGNVSYSALADAVKAECGVLEDDPNETVRRKAAAAAERLLGSRELAPSIEVLVGSGVEHNFSREDLFESWRRFLEKMTSGGPLVLQLEDLHWADEGLLDFVDHLADWAEGPLLVLGLARHELLERRPGWGGGKRNYSAIYLDPLTRDETEAMLEDLLSVRLPDELVRLVVDRSEGNPLFTEEVVRMLIDRGIVRSRDAERWQVIGSAGEIEVPRSIQALIAARLDSLPPDEKAALQDAAVVGRTFWRGALERLSGRDPRGVRDLLGRLRVKEIVVPRETATFSGESELMFRHVLLRDVAYESLPKSSRANKHVEVASWAEDHAGERREEIAELLATHYSEALRYRSELGEPDLDDLRRRSRQWARSAGERCVRLWQLREAARWFRLAAELGDLLDAASEERAADWESYARAGEAVEPYSTLAIASERALELYRALGRDADTGRIEAWLAHVAFQSGDEEGVLRWAQRALGHLERVGDGRDLALALIYRGWYHHRLGRDELAAPDLRRAMAIAERVGDPVVHGESMLSLGMLLYKSTRSAEGLSLLESALQVARQSGDLPFLLRALLVVSEAMELVSGDYPRAEALVREGLELARRAGHVEQVAWMYGNLSDYLVDMGRLEEAEAPAREGLRAARATGELPRIGYSLAMLAFVLTLRSELDEAEGLLVELRPVTEQMVETYLEGWLALIEASIARGRGDDAHATDVLLAGARNSAGRLEAWAGQLLLLECVRVLAQGSRAEEAGPFRMALESLAATSVPSGAFLVWADGLRDPDPDRRRASLGEAANQLERLGRQLEHGRCLVDLAEAERALGRDPKPTLARARQILEACGATLYLRELEQRELRSP